MHCAFSAFIPISQAAKVGNLMFPSGVTTVAKEKIAMMAGIGALDVTMKATGSQTASVVAGMIASGAAGHGLNAWMRGLIFRGIEKILFFIRSLQKVPKNPD